MLSPRPWGGGESIPGRSARLPGSAASDGYIAEVYEAYRREPASVDESWRQFFRFAERLGGALPETVGAVEGAADVSLLTKAAAAASPAESIRAYGHLASQIDPLGNTPHGTPELTPEFHGISEADLERVAGALRRGDAERSDDERERRECEKCGAHGEGRGWRVSP